MPTRAFLFYARLTLAKYKRLGANGKYPLGAVSRVRVKPADTLITNGTVFGDKVILSYEFFLKVFIFDFPKEFIAFALPGAYNSGLLKTGWNNAENALFAMKPGTA